MGGRVARSFAAPFAATRHGELAFRISVTAVKYPHGWVVGRRWSDGVTGGAYVWTVTTL